MTADRRTPADSHSLPGVEKRVDRLQKELDDHRRDDLNQFDQLRGDIRKLGTDLGARIDEMAEGLQKQIDKMTLAKERAEGKAEGLAEAKTAQAKDPWWVVWARTAIFLTISGAVSLIVGLIVVIWNLEQEKITGLQHQPAASVTVNPAPAQPSPPILPLPPTS